MGLWYFPQSTTNAGVYNKEDASDEREGDAVPNHANPHMQIARKLQAIETLKVQLLQQVVDVQKGIQSGNDRELQRNLAGVIGIAYLLGLQIGHTPEQLDALIETGIPRGLIRDEQDIADVDTIKRYISGKR